MPEPSETFPPLSADLLERIREAAGHYPEPSGASIEALQLVQDQFGWVCDRHLEQAAAALGLSAAALDSVATFYNLIYRRPVGRQVIHYCDSVSCWMLGAEQVKQRLCRRLGVEPGGTSADGAYTLLPIVCLGACDRAPALLLGRRLYGAVDPERLDALFESTEAP